MNEQLVYLCTKESPMPAERERDQMGQHWVHRDAYRWLTESRHVTMQMQTEGGGSDSVLTGIESTVTMKCPHCGITFTQYEGDVLSCAY